MNDVTKAVLKYRRTKEEIDFQPIWKHFEPKIKYMAQNKSTQLPVDRETLYEIMVDGLLLAINKFDAKKSEFSTYLYRRIQGKITSIMAKVNRPKHCVHLKTTPLTITTEDGNEVQLSLSNENDEVELPNDHAVLANRTIDHFIKG